MSDARKHTKHTKTHKTYVLVCARARAYTGQLYSKVAEIRGYPRAAFKLTLDDAVVVEEEDGARRLGDVLLERGTNFLKMALKRSPDYESSEHDHLFDTGAANTPTHTAPASSLTVSISKSAAARPGYAGGATKFCGLSNQVYLLYWYKSAITGTQIQILTSKFCGLLIPGCDMLHELAAAESVYDA